MTTPSMDLQAFQYQNLNHENNEIRLLRLLPVEDKLPHTPTTNSSDICCQIFHASLDDPPKYNALSYTWGAATDPEYDILIDGEPFAVRENLYHALTQFRTHGNTIVIWIDAICIDQNNTPERNAQVTKMKSIYEQAESVLVWVGPSFPESHLGAKLICELHSHGHSDEGAKTMLTRPNLVASLESFAILLTVDYWTRMWVIQELTFARRLIFYCGEDSFSGDALSQAQHLLESADTYKEILKMLPFETRVALRSAMAYKGMALVEKWRLILSSQLLSCFDCIQFHEYQLATDPRDKIYGLLSMVPPSLHQFPVDYSLSTRETYINFAKSTIYTTKKLNILTRVLAGYENEEYDLPSWVPDWSAVDFFLETYGGPVFLWSIRETDRPDYTAAGETQADTRYIANGDIIIVKGIRVCTIEDFGHDTNVSNINNDVNNNVNETTAIVEWWDFLVRHRIPANRAMRLFVRTVLILNKPDWEEFSLILGGEDAAALQLTRDIANHCSEVLGDVGRSSTLFSCLNAYEAEYVLDDIRQKHTRAWIYAGFYAIKRRRLFIGDGVVGLSHMAASVGDIVVVPLGCSMPIVLHPVEDHYTVIGEAYVDGYMHGEALEALERGEVNVRGEKFQLKNFELH